MKNDSTELHFFAEVKSLIQRKRALIFLLMRISVVNLIIILSCTCMAYSIPARGQSIETTYVKLAFDKVPIESVFDAIEEQTSFSFSVPTHKINTTTLKVSIDAGTYTVKEALDIALKRTGISYEQSGDFIFIDFKNEKKKSPAEKEMPGKKIHQTEARSAALVVGTVKDASTQEPLAGVNIIVKGTTKGTTTDVEGRFGIEAEENDILIFTFIGFKSFETQIGGRSEIDVSMESDVTALQQVEINAGYWNVKEKENTGNIAKVSSQDIEKQPVSNPLQSLIGRVSGVNITQRTGLSGGAITVQIRGRNSIARGTDPLFIIDGIPFTSTSISSSLISSGITLGGNPLSSINPSDIESIEILKDADATAIYGSRGANGVILITTKKGKIGAMKVDVNVYSGVGKVARTMDLLNTQEYLEMRKEAFVNDGVTPTAGDARDLLVWDTTRYTDWQRQLIGGTQHVTNAQTSLSGGDRNTQYMFGGGYYGETTVFPFDFAYRKASAHLNLTQSTVDQKFRIILTANYASESNKLPQRDMTSQVTSLPPNTPEIHDDNGNLNWGPPNGSFNNPFGALKRRYNSYTDNLISNLILSYQITPGLQLKASVGYNNFRMNETRTTPKSSSNPSFNPSSSSYFSDNHVKTWIVEPQAEYKTDLLTGKLHILIGSTFQQNLSNGKTFYATGFSNDAFLENIAAASSVLVLSPNYSEYRYQAFFGRVNYDFKGKYLINLTARRDGSSRFGPDKQFANFGAVGAAWVFSKERFLRDRFFSHGKLRASYGTAGNDQIGDYDYLDTWTPTSYPYQNANGLFPTRLSNDDYGWEINRKFETALELGLAKDRILLTASYYRNRSSNQLLGYSLPYITGFPSIQKNLPATIENSGLEFELNTSNIESQTFSWNTALNLTVPKNKLVEYPNLEASSYANSFVVGESLNIQKNYHFLGIDPQTGLFKFEDKNENGSGTDYPADLQGLKSIEQTFYGGFNNTLTYKGWQLDFFFQFVKQTGWNYFYNNGNIPGFFGNQPAFVLDRWQKQGDNASYQRFTQTYEAAASNYFNYQFSDGVISDASFIRLKNLSISYQFSGRWIQRLRMKNCRIYMQGQNLITITNYLGLDPENQSHLTLPPLKTATIGFQLTF